MKSFTSTVKSQDSNYCHSLLVLEAVGDQLALAHIEQPDQLPAAVLTPIEGREPAQFK